MQILLLSMTLAGQAALAADGSCSGLRRYLEVDREAGLMSSTELTELLQRHCERTTVVSNPEGHMQSMLAKLQPVARRDVAPIDHSVSGLLRNESGSCASIVALVLGTMGDGSEITAEVRLDHVLLRIGARTFEPLEQGRELTEQQVANHAPEPAAERPVDAVGFLPYYTENLASRLLADGERERAIGMLESVVRDHPESSRFRYSLGAALLAAGRYADAERQLMRARELGRETAELYTNLALACRGLGRLDEAQEFVREALRVDPGNRRALALKQALESRC